LAALTLAAGTAQTTPPGATPSAAKPDASRLKTGVFVYQDLDRAQDAGKGKITIRKLPGSDNYSFSAEIKGKFSQSWESIATVDLQPVSAKLSFGEGKDARPAFDLKYHAGKVTGLAYPRDAACSLGRAIEASLPAGTIDQRIDWAAVLALDLETGKTFVFNVYDPSTGVSRVTAEVGPVENVRVPAGSFQAYRIAYHVEKAGKVETYQVLASGGPQRMLVREEFPNGLVTELTEIGEIGSATPQPLSSH
jgi:hypothetical protein